METVLLTGCSGFVGWKTALLLLRRGCRVVGVDNLNDYYDVSLKEQRLSELEKHPDFRFSKLDIEDRVSLFELFGDNKFSSVINLAARAGVRYSIQNPYVYFSTNMLGTLNLLELMKEHGVSKFVLASTSSLYAGQETPFREDLPVNRPISPYAASKKAAEVASYTYHYMYGIDVTVLRYFTVYGPSGRPDMSIFRFIKWIDEGTPLEIFGDGTQSRDFTYIDDIAEGTVSAARIKTGYEIINLGNNSPHDLNRIISLIEDCLGRKSSRKNMPFSRVDMKDTCADISKAGELLGWQPKVPIEEGIKRTVSWHMENKSLLKNIKL